MKITPVILCGGIGSRLWPMSREAYPKQLASFGGGHSLFQDTVARVASEAYARPIIVTSNDHRFLIAEQLRALNIEADILLEPMRRDSCAAIAAAARQAMRRDPDAVMLVLAADHAIPDIASFNEHVQRGLAPSRDGVIVTFGIKPRYAATGYGYIRPGAPMPAYPGVQAIGAFVEKPDAATAEHYVADGYLWNSGNFMFAAATFLKELSALASDIHDPAIEAVDRSTNDLDFIRLDPEAFGRARAQSVDYALMEKTRRAAVIASDFHWSDIGSWGAVHALAAKDDDGNAVEGDGVFLSARNSYIHSVDKLTTVVGIDDVIVVSTRDVTLVTSTRHSEKVKELVAKLSTMGRREVAEHLRNYRPWGEYEQITRGVRHQVKRIVVKPGGILSLQSHFHRAEHWVVVTGTARVTVDDKVMLLGENQSVYIPLGAVHRLENPGQIPLELIEVQSGSYLGEDDIVRYDDAYNRS